jgi:hypothetical protein
MRKQYHFRPSVAGLMAWDISRLVALSKHLELQLVPLSSIGELDEPYWDERMTCRRVAEHAQLINDADLAYPVILASDGRVMDGMHRVLKALMRGESHIHAVRFRTDPDPDFVGVRAEDLPYDEEAPVGDKA